MKERNLVSGRAMGLCEDIHVRYVSMSEGDAEGRFLRTLL